MPGEIRDAAISASGNVIVYDVAPSPFDRRDVHALDLSAGVDRFFYGDALLQPAMPAVSNDGGTELYLAPVGGVSQVFVVLAGGAPRQVTEAAEGIAEATLSGDGRIVYAATSFGRILRLDPAAITTVELVGRTPSLSGNSGDSLVPGFPLPDSGPRPGGQDRRRPNAASPRTGGHFGETRGRAGSHRGGDAGTDLDPGSLGPPGRRCLTRQPQYTVDAQLGSSAFVSDGPVVLPSRVRQPRFEHAACPGNAFCPAIAHHDFSGLVTREHPAQAGEVVHAYMTGLGAVDPKQPDDTAGPVSPLARTVQPPHCFLLQGIQGDGMPVLFAGLAPGMIGIYQVSFTLPARIWSDWPGLECRSGDTWEDLASWWIFTQPNSPIPVQ